MNSNNWQTEAEIRNKRKAKADSMQALLDHVEWNPDTLEIKLDGVTLNWGDIEGADNVVKKDVDGIAYMTKITKDTIETGTITANDLHITGGSIAIRSSAATSDRIELVYGGVGLGINNSKILFKDANNDCRLTIGDTGSGRMGISGSYFGTSGIHVFDELYYGAGTANKYLRMADIASSFFSSVPSSHSSAPTFFRPVGYTNSSHTSVGYMTKSEMQSWLGIEST